jgi:DNA-damage-inducible protein J
MTTLTIRIDKKTKDGAASVFEKFGLDLSTGIRMFLRQVERDREVPLTLKLSKEDRKFKRALDKSIKEVKRGKTKSFNSAEELFRDILGDKKYKKYSHSELDSESSKQYN